MERGIGHYSVEMRYAQDALNAARARLAELHPTYRQAAEHAKPSFAVAAAMCSPKPGLRCARRHRSRARGELFVDL